MFFQIRMRRKQDYSHVLSILVFSCVPWSVRYLWVEKVCVHHSALYVIQVRVVLQRPLQETSLLTQLCHMSAIIVGEHLIAQDGICNLQDVTQAQIHFNAVLSFATGNTVKCILKYP